MSLGKFGTGPVGGTARESKSFSLTPIPLVFTARSYGGLIFLTLVPQSQNSHWDVKYNIGNRIAK